MTNLKEAAMAWGTAGFAAVLKQEIEQLGIAQLPLQQGLAHSSYVTDTPVQAMILKVSEAEGIILAQVGIFYSGVIAGCNCADDPSPVEENQEYCECLFEIQEKTGETSVRYLCKE
ncbi:hypothetical protein [Candidatus Venteria ishoeyi]|uniref:Uncharacterized protein n=1 Tax=Candidatus Venteria ishoeyi TaxID=1899563 RepID=A0A1H6FCJ2_9GAMM|nr:hypothetical protein [Candidatus Venteria ishoeyi]SEH06735.1 Uncharacterised protein [Candidatus Venteria ishoeyi]